MTCLEFIPQFYTRVAEKVRKEMEENSALDCFTTRLFERPDFDNKSLMHGTKKSGTTGVEQVLTFSLRSYGGDVPSRNRHQGEYNALVLCRHALVSRNIAKGPSGARQSSGLRWYCPAWPPSSQRSTVLCCGHERDISVRGVCCPPHLFPDI